MQGQRAEIGNWYRDRQSGAEFEVVAIDDDSESIDVQMLEGELCEYDADNWRELDLEPIEEPHDWQYVADQTNEGDRSGGDNWDNPLDMFEPKVSTGLFDDDAL